jgi:hypothetical protein
MIPRRHDFRPASRSDDESTSIAWLARRNDAEGGRKACRPCGVGRKRAICGVVATQQPVLFRVASSLRLASGPFPAHRGIITFWDSVLAFDAGGVVSLCSAAKGCLEREPGSQQASHRQPTAICESGNSGGRNDFNDKNQSPKHR